MKLNDADKICIGGAEASAVYAGATKVWPEEIAVELKQMVVTYTASGSRDDYTGWVGMVFTVSNNMLVTQIGKRVGESNSGNHIVTLGKRPQTTQLRTAAINMTGGALGSFRYGDIEPLVLDAGQDYMLVASVTGATGQYWSDAGGVGTTVLQDATNPRSAYSGAAMNLNVNGDNNGYVGLDLTYQAPGTAALGTWDAGYKSAEAYLFNQGKSLASHFTGSYPNVSTRGTTSHGGTDKVYFEVRIDTMNEHTLAIGLANSSAPLDGIAGAANTNGVTIFCAPAQGYGVHNASSEAYFFTPTNLTFANGDVVGFHVDLGARRVWFSQNGVVKRGNPVTGTDGCPFPSAGTGIMYPWITTKAWGTYGGAAIVTLDTHDFAYAPLSGFTAWDA